MKRLILVMAAAGLASSACTTVEPIDYASTLCETLPREEYSACASAVLEHYRKQSRQTDLDYGESTSGPIAMVAGGRLYQGHYTSDPFAAYFRVAAGSEVCRGSYNAVTGSEQAILEVACDDGRQGTADLVLDQFGRNGIGRVEFDDGSPGRIVFGHGTAGALLGDSPSEGDPDLG